jgi:AcrR family transcriptional regulator
VLSAATSLFAERGLAGVTVQEIAEAADTHKTTVLYHFGTKEELYRAVLDDALERIAAVMQEFLAGGFEGDHLRERVAYLLDQIHSYFAEHPEHARLLERELIDIAEPSAYLNDFFETIYLPAVAGLEEAVQRGIIRPVDPAFFIHDMHVLLVGYFCHRSLLERLKPADAFSIDSLIARRNHLVEIIFSLLRPNEGVE